MANKKTLVLGASQNPDRYSYLAMNKLKQKGHEVVAVGLREAVVNGMEIVKEKQAFDNVDTVTLYLNPQRQQEYYDYILSLHPKRIIFNPGTENDELWEKAKAKGIQPVEACTLVMLSTGQH